MKLLYDRLRIQERDTPLARSLADATVFYNDDALQRAVAGEIALEELPSLAPPYDKFFIECRVPMFDALKRAGALSTPLVGILINAVDIGADEAVRWEYRMVLFMENQNTYTIERLGTALVLLDGDGQAVEFQNERGGEPGYCYFAWAEQYRAHFGAGELTGDHYVLPQLIIDAAMYTVGMLHCRNIGTDIVAPRRAEAHKFEKRYAMPMARYHVLKVTGKGYGAGEHIGVPTGQHKPLHWCRGHFKHYTDEAPLMGKHTGTYYFGAHVRGRANAGSVVKDYDVAVQS